MQPRSAYLLRLLVASSTLATLARAAGGGGAGELAAPAVAVAAQVAQPASESQASWQARLPMAFVQNEGQWDPSIRFMILNARGRGWLTDKGFVAQLIEHHRTDDSGNRGPPGEGDGWYEGVNVMFTFEGANPSPTIEADDALPGRYHFFIDADPAGWRREVRSYSRVVYREMYPGIDVEYYEKEGHLEYDLVLRPEADPHAVVLRCDGAESLSLYQDGSCRITTRLGEILHTKPVITQQSPVSCASVRLLLDGDRRVAFAVDDWDGHSKCRIDPGLVYGSYLGGAGSNGVRAVTVNALKQLIVAGTAKMDFPTTPGSFQEAYAGGIGDATITLLSADGATLLFSTYLGTSDSAEAASGLALSGAGDVLLSGATDSTAFPVTSDAIDSTINGGTDMWFVRLAADGSSLLYSTYFGGSGSDSSANIAVGPTGDIYLAGQTGSSDFPTSANALAAALLADEDAYIIRLTPEGSGLLFSTYAGSVGGSALSVGASALDVDSDGAVYIAGRVTDPGLPVSAGAFDRTYNGEMDAFVMKLDASGSFIHYCTYFGDVRWEDARGINVDASGSAYIMGMTDSFNLPVTPGAYSSTLLGSDCPYVAKFSVDGSDLEYCTYAGGNCFNDPQAFVIDAAGCAYVGGLTCQAFPTTPDAIKHGTLGNPTDGFLLKLDPLGSSVVYATLIGGDTSAGSGSASETVRTMALDGYGGVYLAGETASTDFPATIGAYDTEMAGMMDGFILKLDFGPWTNVGHALVGTGGLNPFLGGSGSLNPGSSGSVTLYDAKPLVPATLVAGLASLNAVFKGGTMVPNPLLLIPLATNASGGVTLSWSNWPPGLPAGTQLLLQYWIVDTAGPAGFSASNGLSAVMPAGMP